MFYVQDGSCDEYLLLIEKRDSCEKESEDIVGSEKTTNCIPVDIDPYLCDGVLHIPKPVVDNGTAPLQTDSSLDSAYGSHDQKVHRSLPVSSISSYMSSRGHQTSDDSSTSEASVFSPMTSSIKVPADGAEDSHTLTQTDAPTGSTDTGALSEIPENAVTLAQDHHNHTSELPPVNHEPFWHTPAAANPLERGKQPGRKHDPSEIPRHQSYSGRKASYIIKKVNKALSEPAPVSWTKMILSRYIVYHTGFAEFVTRMQPVLNLFSTQSDILTSESLHELKELQLQEQTPWYGLGKFFRNVHL